MSESAGRDVPCPTTTSADAGLSPCPKLLCYKSQQEELASAATPEALRRRSAGVFLRALSFVMPTVAFSSPASLAILQAWILLRERLEVGYSRTPQQTACFR